VVIRIIMKTRMTKWKERINIFNIGLIIKQLKL